MKKLIFTIILVTIFLGTTFAQKPSMFRAVPTDLFTKEVTVDRTIKDLQGQFLWRFGIQVKGFKYTWNVEDKRLDASFLDAFGPAISYKHFYALPDGTPASNWGINGAFLLGPDQYNLDASKLEITVNLNIFNMAVGPVYTVNSPNHWGFMLNATFGF